MDYFAPALSDDQNMILDSVREFATSVVAPQRESIDQSSQLNADVLTQLAELGLLAIPIPEEAGGAGFDQVAYLSSIETLSSACPALGLHVAIQTSLFLEPLASWGCEGGEQALMDVAMGNAKACIAMDDAGMAFDLKSLTAAVSNKDGAMVLNGTKDLVLGGDEASWGLIAAKEDDQASFFLVNLDQATVKRDPSPLRLGMRGIGTAKIHFKDCPIEERFRLGTKADGKNIAGRIRSSFALAITAMAAGISSKARDLASVYASERKQFGRAIAGLEAIRAKIASTEIAYTTALNLYLSGARLLDEGKDAQGIARVAKVVASEAAMKACDEALQTYGGYGYSEEYPIESFYRDARYLALAMGGNQILRLDMADRILSDSLKD